MAARSEEPSQEPHGESKCIEVKTLELQTLEISVEISVEIAPKVTQVCFRDVLRLLRVAKKKFERR